MNEEIDKSQLMEQSFDAVNDEFLRFDRIENPLSKRPDLCGFLYLDKLFPRERDMISAAEHDEIWLDIDIEEIYKLSEEDIIYLTRCGIRFDRETESLAMFV